MIVFVQVLPYFTAASFRFPERNFQMGGIPFFFTAKRINYVAVY